MSDASRELEQLIQRIESLIDPSATVLWNQFIPDPANPSQQRQIDVTIDRDGFMTHVECRAHSRPQDVGWIESLIGRRHRLGADSVIAVSSSGFYQTAINAAKADNIELRDLHTLSDSDIASWSDQRRVWLRRLEFLGIEIEYWLLPVSNGVRAIVPPSLYALHPVLELCCDQSVRSAEDRNLCNHPCTVTFKAEVTLAHLPNAPRIGARCRVRVVPSQIQIPVRLIRTYTEPDTDLQERTTHHTHYQNGAFEILQHRQTAQTTVDLAAYPSGPNQWTYGGCIDFGCRVSSRGFKVIGVARPQIAPNLVQIQEIETPPEALP